MNKIILDDTIAAISTAAGESGIGIVRISGRQALSIADKIFLSKTGQKPSEFKTYTTHYGFIVEPGCPARGAKHPPSAAQYIDEVILTVMLKPATYTRQDIVEINCHGGIIPLRKTLELVLACGARLSRPGEFTQRAFLNGRIDFTQAEAVLDIIRSKTDSALRVSLQQLRGALSNKINRLRQGLLGALAMLEANIDFPDEDLGGIDIGKVASVMERAGRQLQLFLENARNGRVLREGVRAVICGRPNAGKSLLLNVLLKYERSIVTPIEGTTRDTIEDILDIKGIPVRIVDTAGIIEPRDLIERKAVSRSHECIKQADLILFVFDGSRPLSYEDKILMRRIKSKPTIALINKIDLKQKIQRTQINRRFKNIVEISAKRQRNINLLEEAIARSVFNGKIKSDERVWVTNLRHIQQLRKTKRAIMQSLDSIRDGLSVDCVAQSLTEAIRHLDEIQGRRPSADLLDIIFSEFCIGK